MSSLLIIVTRIPTSNSDPRVYYMIKELSKNNKITVLVIPSYENSEEDLKQLKKFCEVIIPKEIEEILLNKNKYEKRAHKFKEKCLRKFRIIPPNSELVSRHYYMVLRYKEEIKRLLEIRKFDFIQIEHFYMGLVLNNIKTSAKKILVYHNVHSYMKNNIIEKVLIRNDEKRFIKDYDIVVCCSEVDKKRLQKIGYKNILVVPNGVDTNYFNFPINNEKKKSLLFVGDMYYKPNYEGIKYFFEKIYPLLDLKISINIIGKYKEEKFKEEKRLKNVKFHGFVEDIRPYFKNSIFICPLLDGGGTRLKIFTAFASGSSVVSTSKGAEGIDYTNCEDILISNNLKEFVENINKLLEDKKLYNKLRVNARKLVEDKYDWKEIWKDYDKELNKFIS